MNFLSQKTREELERLPPQNLEAEMAVLGAMLLEETIIPEILEIINEDDFYKQEHKLIFSSIVSLFDSRRKCDILTVAEDLGRKRLLEKVGGASYLATLETAFQSLMRTVNISDEAVVELPDSDTLIWKTQSGTLKRLKFNSQEGALYYDDEYNPAEEKASWSGERAKNLCLVLK